MVLNWLASTLSGLWGRLHAYPVSAPTTTKIAERKANEQHTPVSQQPPSKQIPEAAKKDAPRFREQILDMDPCLAEKFPGCEPDSEYRVLRSDGRIAYLTIGFGIFDDQTLMTPPWLLAALVKYEFWSRPWRSLRISLDTNKELQTEENFMTLHGLDHTIFPSDKLVNFLSLKEVISYHPSVYKVMLPSGQFAVMKYARFDYEFVRIEDEIKAYHALQSSNLTPRLLGYVYEDEIERRVIGILCEYIDGRAADIGDMQRCKDALITLHSWGILHGDLNRNNFIVTPDGVKVIDFDKAVFNPSESKKKAQLARLQAALTDTSDKGSPW